MQRFTPPTVSPASSMRWPRRFVSAWWLTLIVVSCLFARPMHEWLDARQAAHAAGPVAALGSGLQQGLQKRLETGQPQAGTVPFSVDTPDGPSGRAWGADSKDASHGAEQGDSSGDSSGDPSGSPEGGPDDATKPPACAWCLMLGQAQAPAGVPVMLLAHEEASAPPIFLEPGRPTGRCTLAAEPRGPPQA